MLNDLIKKTGVSLYRISTAKQNEEYILKKGFTYLQLAASQCVDYVYRELQENNLLEEFNEMFETVKKDRAMPPSYQQAQKIINQYISISIPCVRSIVYKVSDEEIITDKIGEKYFNSYTPSYMITKALHCPREKLVSKAEFKEINEVALNLCENCEKSLNFFYDWLAFQILHPNKRLPHAIIFKGAQGTGKTLFFNKVWGEIIGHNYGVVGQTQLESNYNGYLLNKRFLYVNEVSNNKGKYEISDKIKAVVTDDCISIERKFHNPITYENPLSIVISSNHIVPIPLEQDDRRYSVFESSKLEDGERIYNAINNNTEMIENFLHFLLQRKITSDIQKCYMNRTKQKVLTHSGNNLDLFYYDFVAGYQDMLEELEQEYNTIKTSKTRDDELYIQYEKYLKVSMVTHEDKLYIKSSEFYNFYKTWCTLNGIKRPFDRKNFINYITDRQYKFSKGFVNLVLEDGSRLKGRYFYIEKIHVRTNREEIEQ